MKDKVHQPAKSETLGYAERWMRDGMAVLQPALSVIQVSVDMTQVVQTLEALKKQGVMATPTHLLVKATAEAFAANPDLHQIVGARSRYYPGRIDIGLSISGDTFVDPVLVIEGADSKTIPALVEEITRRSPEAREANRRMMAGLNRWGRWIPFGFVRRYLLRLLFAHPKFRTQGVGTFQVSVMPGDWGFGSKFATTGLLIAGQVKSRVMVVDDQPAVRLTMLLTLSVDHGAWDGRAAARFLSAVKSELEASQT